jgi:vanillate O-demethylase ferredoxin subunit
MSMTLQEIVGSGIAGPMLLACTRLFRRSGARTKFTGERNRLAVRVSEIRDEAEGIRSFRLEPEAGRTLPRASAGSHVSVWLGDELVRHYSICNPADAPDHYVIAVKLEDPSRGGSEAMHALAPGDRLEISEPRNNFELVEGAPKYLLFAGGIGITPILAMVREIERRGADYHLHYFTRSPGHTAFHSDLSAPELAARVSFHHGVEPGELRTLLLDLVRPAQEGLHLYMCGPRPFMDAVQDRAMLCVPLHAIHREYFSADPAASTAPREEFEVELARSGKTLLVPADTSLLDVLRRNGIAVESSCEDGVCGTCLTQVLDGEPDHRDSFLSEAERRSSDKMLVCVSRSKTSKLVLEL